MKKLFVLTAVCCLLQAPSALGDAVLSLSQPSVETGKEVIVTLKGVEKPEEIRLFVIYLPNSATEHAEAMGPFSKDGAVHWTPEGEGIVTLTARDAADATVASLNKAVRFPAVPALGIVVMIVAGLLLFGGAAASLVMALRE